MRGRFNIDRTKTAQIRHLCTGRRFQLTHDNGIVRMLRATRIRHWTLGGMKITTIYFEEEFIETQTEALQDQARLDNFSRQSSTHQQIEIATKEKRQD